MSATGVEHKHFVVFCQVLTTNSIQQARLASDTCSVLHKRTDANDGQSAHVNSELFSSAASAGEFSTPAEAVLTTS
jgi:hypothetical protein